MQISWLPRRRLPMPLHWMGCAPSNERSVAVENHYTARVQSPGQRMRRDTLRSRFIFAFSHRTLQSFLKNNKIRAAAWKNATYTPTIRTSTDRSAAAFVFFRFSVASSPIVVYILENASAQPRSWNEYSVTIASQD